MPFSEHFGDHFFSRRDGRAECVQVFLGGNGLPARFRDRSRFTIGELGFGSGLNFLETWRQWIEVRAPGQQLDFVSFEAFPMRADDIRRAIATWPDLAVLCEALLAHWPPQPGDTATWRLDAQTTLTVVVDDALAGVANWPGRADAWYLDGFAPSRNPAMWSAELMREVAAHTAPDGRFATYTAAGWVRRNLFAAGFSVEKRPGHGGKREMMCGVLDRAGTRPLNGDSVQPGGVAP